MLARSGQVPRHLGHYCSIAAVCPHCGGVPEGASLLAPKSKAAERPAMPGARLRSAAVWWMAAAAATRVIWCQQVSAGAFVVLRLELQNVEPLIWRVVRVPADLRLRALHPVLQTVMGWNDQHPHSFSDGSANVPHADAPIAESLRVAHSRLTYTYEEQLAWRLRITAARGMWRPGSRQSIICLDGYLAGPGDGSGGPAAYSAILAGTIGHGPKLSRDLLESLGPGFDPERFDRSAINRELAQMRG